MDCNASNRWKNSKLGNYGKTSSLPSWKMCFLVVAQALLIQLLTVTVSKSVAIGPIGAMFSSAMDLFGLDGWRYTLII
jgi:hypothetical protein